jgi:hypothetical protein
VLRRKNKVNNFKEYFDVSISEIKEVVASLGLEAEWTLTGIAREYAESLKINKCLSDGTLSKENYMKRFKGSVNHITSLALLEDTGNAPEKIREN